MSGGNQQLVLDDTLHMVTSERHKTYEKTPILWCTFFESIFGFLICKPTTPSPLSKIPWVFNILIIA